MLTKLLTLILTIGSFGVASTVNVHSTDSLSSIQNNINSANSGDTIIFNSGTYNISTPLIWKSGINLQGNGNPILHGSGHDWIIKTATNQNTGTISGLIFDNGGFLIQGLASGLTISNNTFQNNQNSYAGGNWTLENSIFSGGGGLRNSKITNNIFKNLIPSGKTGSGDYGGNNAIWFYGADAVSIDHNTFDHLDEGIKICFNNTYQSNNMYIGYNKFTNVHRMGMEIQGAQGCGASKPSINGPDTHNFIIEYNSFTNPLFPYWWTYPISLANPAPYGGDGAIIRYNYLVSGIPPYGMNGPNGYGIESGSANMQIYGNTVVGPWGTAITYDGSPNVQIHDNWTCGLANGATVGIRWETKESSNVSIQNNQIHANSCPSNYPNPITSSGNTNPPTNEQTDNPPPVVTTPIGVIDGDFEGQNKWTFYSDGKTTMSIGNDLTTTTGNVAHIIVNTIGTNTQMFEQPIYLKGNTNYTLTYYSVANRNTAIVLSLIKHVAPYTNYGIYNLTQPITTNWTKNSINFTTPNFDINDARLTFMFNQNGQNGDIYSFDNIAITPTTDIPPVVVQDTADPIITPDGQTVFSGLSLLVTINDATPNAIIYYTLDGSEPTKDSLIYTDALNILNTTTLKAIAIAPGDNPSKIISETYVIVPPILTSLVSDNFVWQPDLPLSDETITYGKNQMIINVPAGKNHDAFVGGNLAAKALQPTKNADFDIIVNFESLPNGGYTGEGIMVEQDNTNYLRCEVASNGNTININSSFVSNGKQSQLASTPFTNNGPIWLEVKRVGDIFTIFTSTDGVNFSQENIFTQPIIVTKVGPYAYNYNSTEANAPAMQAIVGSFQVK